MNSFKNLSLLVLYSFIDKQIKNIARERERKNKFSFYDTSNFISLLISLYKFCVFVGILDFYFSLDHIIFSLRTYFKRFLYIYKR